MDLSGTQRKYRPTLMPFRLQRRRKKNGHLRRQQGTPQTTFQSYQTGIREWLGVPSLERTSLLHPTKICPPRATSLPSRKQTKAWPPRTKEFYIEHLLGSKPSTPLQSPSSSLIAIHTTNSVNCGALALPRYKKSHSRQRRHKQ